MTRCCFLPGLVFADEPVCEFPDSELDLESAIRSQALIRDGSNPTMNATSDIEPASRAYCPGVLSLNGSSKTTYKPAAMHR